MDSSLKPVNIWEDALKQKSKQSTVLSNDKTLIVVGNPFSGKFSIIQENLLFQKFQKIKFKHNQNQLIYYNIVLLEEVIYQIASKNQSDIIPTLISKQNYQGLTVAICLDLSKPAKIIQTANDWIAIIKKQVNNAIHQKVGLQQKQIQWQNKRKQQIQKHEDAKIITLPPISIIFVATKYDIFQRYQTQNRKWLAKALRFLTLVNNATLICSSIKNNSVANTARAVMLDCIFEQIPKKISQKDHLRPIFITKNNDTLNQIGIPSSGSVSNIQILKRQISNLFIAQQQSKREGIDLSKYNEIKIDSLLQQRKKQLAKISKNTKRIQL